MDRNTGEITDHNCLGAPHPLGGRRDDNAIMCLMFSAPLAFGICGSPN